MQNPRGFSVSALGLVAGVILAWPIPARGEDVSAATAKPAKGSPLLLLAKVWDPSIDPTGWWMSEKYDGLRSYWDGQQLWSRNGKAIYAPDYFLAELPPDVALDGELWIGRGKFEETSSTVLSETPDDRWKRVRFMVFDAPQVKGTFEQRMEFLHRTLSEDNRFAKVVAQERCQGTAQLLAELDRMVGEGGEGLMLRQPESESDQTIADAAKSETLQ